MKNDKKEHGTIGLMILTVIIIFCVIAIIVGGFRRIKKNEDAKLEAASDTEYIENKQNREELKRQEEQDKEEVEEAEEEVQDAEKSSQSQTNSEAHKFDEAESSSQSQTDVDKQKSNDTESQKTDKSDGSSQTNKNTAADTESNKAVSSDSDEKVGVESSEEDDKVYLIKGDEKSSNRYEKAKHLSYTTTIKYTPQDLSMLDSYGLKITRNEIYARHGRIFNDRDLQEYFERQKWYVPQIASNDFDSSCLNEVERYNIELIKTYEQQVGGR